MIWFNIPRNLFRGRDVVVIDTNVNFYFAMSPPPK